MCKNLRKIWYKMDRPNLRIRWPIRRRQNAFSIANCPNQIQASAIFLVESLTRRSKFEIVSPRIRKWKNVFQKDICQWRHCFPCSVTKFGDQNFPCVTAKTSPFSRVGFGWKNCLLTKLQMTYATLSTIEV
jgi:hypothetical protein